MKLVTDTQNSLQAGDKIARSSLPHRTDTVSHERSRLDRCLQEDRCIAPSRWPSSDSHSPRNRRPASRSCELTPTPLPVRHEHEGCNLPGFGRYAGWSTICAPKRTSSPSQSCGEDTQYQAMEADTIPMLQPARTSSCRHKSIGKSRNANSASGTNAKLRFQQIMTKFHFISSDERRATWEFRIPLGSKSCPFYHWTTRDGQRASLSLRIP